MYAPALLLDASSRSSARKTSTVTSRAAAISNSRASRRPPHFDGYEESMRSSSAIHITNVRNVHSEKRGLAAKSASDNLFRRHGGQTSVGRDSARYVAGLHCGNSAPARAFTSARASPLSSWRRTQCAQVSSERFQGQHSPAREDSRQRRHTLPNLPFAPQNNSFPRSFIIATDSFRLIWARELTRATRNDQTRTFPLLL